MTERHLIANPVHMIRSVHALLSGLIAMFLSVTGVQIAGANVHGIEALQIVPSQSAPTYDLGKIANNAQDSKGYKAGVAILKIGYILGMGQASGAGAQCSGTGGLEGLCALADLTKAIAVGAKTASDVARAPGVLETLNKMRDEIGIDELDGSFSETLDTILDSAYIQSVLAAEVEDFVSAHLNIATTKDESLASHQLQVQITKVQSEGSFVSSRLSMRLYGHARLIKTSDGQVIEDYSLSVETPELTMLDWSEGGASLISEAFASAISQISVVLAEETLAIVTSPSMEKKGYLVDAQTPRNRICPFRCKVKAVKNYGFYETESLTPTFGWDDFLEVYSQDPLQADNQLTAGDISYDFRLYKASRLPSIAILYGADTLVLEVKDIIDPVYSLQNALQPCTPYMWTVRSRFSIEGKRYLTRWSGNYKEKDLDKWRVKIGNPTRMDNINLIGGALTGKQDQQIFYREGSYYFAFHTPAESGKCRYEGHGIGGLN